MQLQGLKKYLVALSLLGFCGSGWAAIYPTPIIPGLPLGDDVGTELFALGDSLLTFELLDLGEDTGLTEFEFGYYFGSDHSTLFPIFGKNEATNLKTVNIGSTDPIGFYLQTDAIDLTDPLPDIPATTLFTEESLNTALPNANGVDETDWAAAYPVVSAPFPPDTTDFYLLTFFYPVPTQTGTSVTPIYASVAGPTPVPEPGTILLWLTGLAGLALFRRRPSAGNPVTATDSW